MRHSQALTAGEGPGLKPRPLDSTPRVLHAACPCSEDICWVRSRSLSTARAARPPSPLAPQALQSLPFQAVWCVPPVSPKGAPGPPDARTEPYLRHQGSHLQSQFPVDRKPACHDLSTGLEGQQQALSLRLPFDLTPEVQPTGESEKQGRWGPKRMRSSWYLFTLICKDRNDSFSTTCEPIFYCL